MNASASDTRAQRERILALQGGCNFRDIGGYRTEQGGTVRWGKVFRAGMLTYFTDDDHRSLSPLGVRAICDLRRAEERDREPTRWPSAPTLLSWDDGTDTPTLSRLAAQRPATGAGMFDAMVDLYRVLPAWMGGRIRGMFECVAQGNLPMVVHCAAGKDRTGVAIGVLLRAIGVSPQTAIEDYLLTNEAGNFEEFIRTRHNSELGLTDVHRPLLSMPPEVRAVLFSARPEFLEAAFEQIDRELGGLDAYLERTVNVTSEVRERVVRVLVG